MKWKLTFVLAAGIATLSFCAWFSWESFVLRPVPPHQGDGEFEDLSFRYGPFAVRGYSISMPAFDLGDSFKAEYRISGLTQIRQKCGVYLAVRDPQFIGFAADGGELHFEVTDSMGRSVVKVGGNLSEFIHWQAGDEFHGFYQMEKSFFNPDRREEYRIRISYTAGRKLAGHKGFVYVRCGGEI